MTETRYEQSDFASGIEQQPTLRERFFRSRIGRVAMAGLAGLGLAGGLAAAEFVARTTYIYNS